MSKVEIKNLRRVLDILNVDVDEFAGEVIKDTGLVFDQIANKSINKEIYKRPVSPNYIRTGDARRGRKIKKLTKLKSQHIMNSRIGGADKGYTAALNRNRRIKYFNTFFWDNSVRDLNKEMTGIFKKNKFFKK